MTDLSTDLNATIASAVNARIEASIVEALSGDETLSKYVAAALAQQVEAKPNDRFDRAKTTFLERTLRVTLQEATKAAVERVIADEAPLIEEECRKAIKRQAGAFAEKLTSALGEAAQKAYGVRVEIKLPNESW